MELINFLIISAVSVISFVYFYFKYKFSYWESKGVPFLAPTFPYGSLKGVGKQIHLSKISQITYEKFKGKDKFCGLYFFVKPVALLLDIDLVKNVLIKDFNNFNDRGIYYNEEDDPLSAHLFSLNGKKWKHLRAKLTPTFTSGKMKFMFPTIVEVADRFKNCLIDVTKENEVLEIRELLARFTTDVIGTCAFGIECNSLKDPNAEFRVMGRNVFENPRHPILFAFLISGLKTLSKFFHVKVTRDDVSAFFLKVVNDTIDYREKNNVHRNDFMDILINLKNQEKSVTINEIAAQAFIFFLAGFETSSTTLTFCLYELALNPDIQEKARQEVRKVLQKHNGNFTYEAMMEMHYIEQVINETLRKYPPVANLIRTTQNDYPIQGTNHVLKKGTSVWIPAFAIQRDAEYFPEPDKFIPERFSSEEVANRNIVTFLPFGEGPRNCIGLRFGMMQARVGLATLLNNFELSICPKTNVPLTFSPSAFILGPEGGLYLNVKNVQI